MSRRAVERSRQPHLTRSREQKRKHVVFFLLFRNFSFGSNNLVSPAAFSNART